MAFRIKTNDTSPKLGVTIKDVDGNAVDITGNNGVRFHMKAYGSNTLTVDAAALVTDATNGAISYEWVAGDTATAGTYYGEFEVTYADDRVETFPNKGYFTIIIQEDLD